MSLFTVQICCSGDIKFSTPELFLIGKKTLGANKTDNI